MMPRSPRPFTGQTAWWVFVIAVLVTIGIAQLIVFGVTTLIDGSRETVSTSTGDALRPDVLEVRVGRPGQDG